MTNRYTMSFTAGPEHIDVLGHVNNAVWVQWMEAIATAHWEATARAQDQAQFIWVVTRHEIDYRGNIVEGQSVTAETWIPQGPTGARFSRCVEFRNAEGKAIISACSTWAMIDKMSGRLVRIRPDVAAAFAPFGPPLSPA